MNYILTFVSHCLFLIWIIAFKSIIPDINICAIFFTLIYLKSIVSVSFILFQYCEKSTQCTPKWKTIVSSIYWKKTHNMIHIIVLFSFCQHTNAASKDAGQRVFVFFSLLASWNILFMRSHHCALYGFSAEKWNNMKFKCKNQTIAFTLASCYRNCVSNIWLLLVESRSETNILFFKRIRVKER